MYSVHNPTADIPNSENALIADDTAILSSYSDPTIASQNHQMRISIKSQNGSLNISQRISLPENTPRRLKRICDVGISRILVINTI